MRSREEIEKDMTNEKFGTDIRARYILEVLLDIRDLLIKKGSRKSVPTTRSKR